MADDVAGRAARRGLPARAALAVAGVEAVAVDDHERVSRIRVHADPPPPARTAIGHQLGGVERARERAGRVQTMPLLQALDRALGGGPEDAVGMQAEPTLEHAHRRAPRADAAAVAVARAVPAGAVAVVMRSVGVRPATTVMVGGVGAGSAH